MIGKEVCEIISDCVNGDGPLVLYDIETLCSTNCDGLGRLWRQVCDGCVELSVLELTDALTHADQVINLDVRLKEIPARQIFIEDGELIENSLAKDR